MLAAADDLKRVTLRLGSNDAAIVPTTSIPTRSRKASSGARSRTQVRSAPRSSASTCPRRCTTRSSRSWSIVRSAPRSATAWRPTSSSARSTTTCSSKGPKPGRGREEVGRQRSRSAASAWGRKATSCRRRSSPVSAGAEAGRRGAVRHRAADHQVQAPLGRARAGEPHHYGLGGSGVVVEPGPRRRSGTGSVRHRGVNQHIDLSPLQPFGGHKWNGIGVENGKWGYNEFTQVQVVDTKSPDARRTVKQQGPGERTFPGPSRFEHAFRARDSPPCSAGRSAD